jgi:hypothetical protein
LCRSVDCCSSACKVDENNSSLLRPTHHRRLCSNSQFPKRRQLAHGARNRACQLIGGQVPARSTKTTAISFRQTQTNTYRPPPPHVPTHRSTSDDSWPTALGIVPVSRLLCNNLQCRRKIKAIASVQTNANASAMLPLTAYKETTAGTRCSESCRSIDCWTNPCKSRRPLSVQSNTNTSSPTAASVPTHRNSSDDSWPTVLGIVPVS